MIASIVALAMLVSAPAPGAASGPEPSSPVTVHTSVPDTAPAATPTAGASSLLDGSYPDLAVRAAVLPAVWDDSDPAGPPDYPQPEPAPEPEPAAPADDGGIAGHWLELARCESGNWIDGGRAFEGPIRWDWGAPGMQLPPWGTSIHHGGLQFAPSTWEWVAPDVLGAAAPTYAYQATPRQQVAVAEEVQRRQGWGAWPICSRKVGLR